MKDKNLQTKYKVVENASKGVYMLVVKNFSKQDEGVYACYMNDNNDNPLQQYHVYLLEQPKHILVDGQSEDGKISGIEGENVTIHCSVVGGQPVPRIWLLDGKTVLNSSDSGSVRFTLYNISRRYDSKKISCQAKNRALQIPLSKDIHIFLALKPSIPCFEESTFVVEEAEPLNVMCISFGSRPPATLHWFIDDQNITQHAIAKTNHVQNSDTYAVTSALIFYVDKYHNNGNITCAAKHTETNTFLLETEKLTVKFAPIVWVNNKTAHAEDTNITLKCFAYGNPPIYTFYKWRHMSFHNELLRILPGQPNGNLILPVPDTSAKLQSTDSGIYICSADNGIADTKGHLEQTGSGVVLVKSNPEFTADNELHRIQYGDIGSTANIRAYAYSVPKYNTITWHYINILAQQKGTRKKLTKHWNIEIEQSQKYEMFERPSVLWDARQNAHIDGFVLTLRIHNVTLDDSTTYRVILQNEFGMAEKSFDLLPSGVPDTPKRFKILSNQKTSLTLQWWTGFDGGHKQTFYIDYRAADTSSWDQIIIPVGTGDEGGKLLKYTLKDLFPSTMYEMRLGAFNIKGKCDPTYILFNNTLPLENTLPFGPVTGALGGVLAAAFIICMTAVYLKERLVLKGNFQFGFGNTSDRLRAAWRREYVHEISRTRDEDFVIDIQHNDSGVSAVTNRKRDSSYI